MGELNFPEEMVKILIGLYNGPKRSGAIPEMIPNLSEPTVYKILKELTEKGYLNKNVRSKRKIFYELTDKGKELIEEEHFKAVETLVSIIRDSPSPKEVMAEVIMQDVLEKLPSEWHTEKRESILKEIILNSIENKEKELLNIAKNLIKD